MKVRLKSEEKISEAMQTYESFCLVASAALGGKSSTPRADPSKAPKTADQLEAALKRSIG